MSANAPIRRCPSGHDAGTCADLAAGHFPRGREGDKRNRLCPCHDDTKASLSWNPGTRGMWMVWCCGAGCSHEDIRAEALDHGIDPGCLGTYGLPKRGVVPGLRVVGHDPALIAGTKRFDAALKLPSELSGKLMHMCLVALAEGDGDLPGDPLRLLPWTKPEFIALAERSGIKRTYRYKLWESWEVLLLRSQAA